MGRKTSDSKSAEKKAERQRLQQRLDACAQTLKLANAQDNPLASLPSFQKYVLKSVSETLSEVKTEMTLTLTTLRSSALSERRREWAFELVEKNMRELYTKSGWGWNERNKREELFDDRAFFLVANEDSQTDRPVAFAMFRFDLDCDDDVLYVYELQLESHVRRRGLGRFMLQTLELLAVRNDMTKIMLTVFKHNLEAKAFFIDAMKFEVDETSPIDDVHEQFDYLILSRFNKRKRKAIFE